MKKVLSLICGLLLFPMLAFGADNFAVTAGSGTTIATDDVTDAGGANYQKVKLFDATANSTTGAGIAANPLQVSLANHSANATPVLVDLGAADTLGTVSTVTAVTTITNPVAVTNAGITSIDSKVPALGQALAAASVPVILPSATITTLTPPAAITGFATSAKQDTLDTSVNTLLKPASTLAAVTSITNAVAVTNAGITTIAGAVAGTEMQVDVLTMPSTAVTNAGITSIDGKITACNTGAVVLAAGTAEIGKLAAGTAEIGKLGAGTAEIGKLAAGTAVIGSIIPNKFATTDDAAFMKKYYTSAGAATDGIVWSSAAGTRWYVTDLIISTSAAATVTLEDDLAGGDSPVLKLDLAANGGCVVNFKTPLASGEDAADLMVTTSAGNIYITATGYEI